MKAAQSRIPALDGLRAVAILGVLLFHYYYRWAPPRNPASLYPYESLAGAAPLLGYGYLGVQLFFVISGFVISMTLERSRSLADFAVKRFSRLWPTMLLCSSLTFLGLLLIPLKLFSLTPFDFVPSLTFMEPYLWSKVPGMPAVDWIDGAYWSLSVEVRFYAWAAVIYFLTRPRFFTAFFLFTNLVCLAWGLDLWWLHARFDGLLDLAVFPAFIPWFAAGIGFHRLFSDRPGSLLTHLMIAETLALQLPRAVLSHQLAEIPFYFAIYAVFYVLAYRDEWLRPLRWAPLASLGAASYSLYLLHQNLGVTLTAYVSTVLGLGGTAWPVWISLATTATMIGASLLIYRWWEVPARDLLLARLGARIRQR